MLRAGTSEDAAVAGPIEQHQAEPVSAYYAYPDSMFVLQSDWEVAAGVERGTFVGLLTDEEKASEPLLPRGLVTELRDSAGAVLARADAALRGAFAGKEFKGHWLRVPQAPVASLDTVFDELLRDNPHLRGADAYSFGGQWFQTFALVFPEEVRWRGTGPGWVFINLVSSKRGDLLTADRRGPKSGKKGRPR